ncbi:hypothetical protein LOC68_05850 [Blastopirellula sp. JC732]|uniref:Uncharacterized protein n=1 Tax=Blastopirellula sediminis TaxID=2894196 RepID=A0A9X1SFU9_9BACT|nr:hypothetical protein [Blastopirellula sediminis]MCC9609312.1 hypothetical protein [Blastopirellula sediminis]MCC9627911.1 hypothetical protein [Blastopirellula sediminis]
MSITTTYWLIGDAKGIDLGYIAAELPEVLGMKSITWVFRRPFDPHDDRPGVDVEVRNLLVTPHCLPPLLLPNSTLVLDEDSSAFGEQLQEIQRTEIPSEVHGDVILNRLSVEIGQGELEFETDDDGGMQFRKYRVGFCVWTYSTPPDCFAFENYLLNSTGLQALKANLELLVGPLESFLFFG